MGRSPRKGIVKPDGTTIAVGDIVTIKPIMQRQIAENWMKQKRSGAHVSRRIARSLVRETLSVTATSTYNIRVAPQSDPIITFSVPVVDVVKVPASTRSGNVRL